MDAAGQLSEKLDELKEQLGRPERRRTLSLCALQTSE